MADTTIDAPLIDNTDPSHARPLQSGLAAVRTDVLAAARELMSIPEDSLTKTWTWKGGSEEEVRYGGYRAAEALEQAEVESRPIVAASEAGERRAARIVGPATAARWDLHGLLVPLDERLLDADPGGGEWSIRLVLGHIVSSQRAYGWGSAWWQSHPHDAIDPTLPKGIPDPFWATLPDESTDEAQGTLDDLRARLDAILDLSAERLAGLPDDRLDLGARWSGFPVTVGFRLGRWASHLREHGIQIEKTFAVIGHVPSEPARLVHNMLAAYGRAESVVFGRQDVDKAVDRIAAGAAEARQAIRSAREAASA